MKNHWIQTHTKKRKQYAFELIGKIPCCSVKVKYIAANLLLIESHDAYFIKWNLNQITHNNYISMGFDGNIVFMKKGQTINRPLINIKTYVTARLNDHIGGKLMLVGFDNWLSKEEENYFR